MVTLPEGMKRLGTVLWVATKGTIPRSRTEVLDLDHVVFCPPPRVDCHP